MADTFEQGKDEIAKLVEYFRTNHAAFFEPGFKEAHARQVLIDPLLIALGWDVRSEKPLAPQYREVIPEESLDVEGHQKTPDYAFRVGQTTKFYVEAKRLGANLKEDPAPAYQLRSYSWNKKLPLSLLTDFEELAVYDCRIRPNAKDKASVARIRYHTWEEYVNRWREIWDVFSREAVWAGTFDQFAQTSRDRRGTSEVDAEFLREIEGWRERLARNLALRNRRLSPDDLNKAVQLTIDRIVFLRMAEDRGVEPFEQLLRLSEGADIYRRFVGNLCRKADAKYNSGLFHFDKEPGIPSEPDTLTPALKVDDKILKPIFEHLYYPHSPYNFRILPVEILGSIYERFLGKVIKLTQAHHAKVEPKPEVRKAGGVYYTPAYIVDYIVRQTVGPLLDGKSPAQLAGIRNGRPFRVLDMACGSGSFLLGAYQCILDHCLRWYTENDPQKHKPAVWQWNGPGQSRWRLTVGERKRILATHVFGMDIDPQAVEVSKLSLLLKVLEGENDESLGRQAQMRLFDDRALPNLDENVKCGNSLIGPDYFTGRLIPDWDEMRRVNAFDWNQGFPEAMRAGGFDCILGNPPYLRIQTMKQWAPLEVEIYKELFQSARSGNYDIYVVFLEKGLGLLSERGRLGFILPHKFFNSQYGEALRSIVAQGRHLAHVVHFGDQQVFEGATTYTCLLFLDKAGAERCRFVKVDDLAAWRDTGRGSEGKIPAKQVTAAPWNFAVGPGAALFRKLSRMPVKLGDLAEKIAQGIRTSANEVYVLDVIRESRNSITAYSKQLDRRVSIERGAVTTFVLGREIKRFRICSSGKVVIIPYDLRGDRATLIAEPEYHRRFPRAHKYLRVNRDFLANRERGRMRGPNWHGFVYPKNLEVMYSAKILVPDIADRASFTLDEKGEYAFTSGYGITLKSAVQESPRYVLGLLNSPVLDFYLKRVSTPMRGGFFRYFTQFIEQLPVRAINFSDAPDVKKHDRMVTLVDQMLALHKSLAAAESQREGTVLGRQIEATDGEIDRLVYDLYSLSEEEIAIVEASRAAPP